MFGHRTAGETQVESHVLSRTVTRIVVVPEFVRQAEDLNLTISQRGRVAIGLSIPDREHRDVDTLSDGLGCRTEL